MPSVLFFALACTSEPDSPGPAAEDPLDQGWPALLVREPARFTALMNNSSRDGWIAFHRCDFASAAELMAGPPRARALEEQATVERDLASLSQLAWLQLAETWQSKQGIPKGSALPVLAGLAALDAGDEATAHKWLDALDVDASAELKALAADLKDGGLEAVSGADPLASCLKAHASARATGDQSRVEAGCPAGALVRESTGDIEREWFDPLLHQTRATVHLALARAQRTGTQEAPDPLAQTLFSAQWAAGDKVDGTGTLSKIDLGGAVGEGDDGEAVRTWVRRLDAALDAWKDGARTSAGTGGEELLDQLRIVEVYRSRLLVDRGRAALLAGHPNQARTYAQLALDVEHGREVGPLNPPSLFAVLAEANLRTGHSRESLDALEVLSTPLPHVRGVDEVIGDLTVLDNMGRHGDSKEN